MNCGSDWMNWNESAMKAAFDEENNTSCGMKK